MNIEKISATEKDFYKKYLSFYKRSDLFALFVEKALTHLSKNNGIVGFILPSIILNNLSYQPLRDLLLNNHWVSEICYVGGSVFHSATVDTSVLIFDKKQNPEITLSNAVDFYQPKTYKVPNDYFKQFRNIINIGEENSNIIIDKLFLNDFVSVDDCFTVFQGIVTGNNDAFIFENEDDAIQKGIETELLHSLCYGRDIGKWEVKSSERKILYLDKNVDITNYNGANNWLIPKKEILSQRRECLKGVISWYSLQWARVKSELDIKEKILIQNTRNESLKTRIVATIDKQGVYATQGINFVIPKTTDYSIYFLLSLLNSNLVNYLFSKKFLNLAIKAEYIKQIKFPKLSLNEQQPFIELADKMLLLNAKFNDKKYSFINYLKQCFDNVKIKGKLNTFWILDFDSIVDELKKQKVKLPSELHKLKEHFTQCKDDCIALQDQITATDNEINQLVYQLYGLTAEEIAIIEK